MSDAPRRRPTRKPGCAESAGPGQAGRGEGLRPSQGDSDGLQGQVEHELSAGKEKSQQRAGWGRKETHTRAAEDPAAAWLDVVLAVEPLWALYSFSKWFPSICVQSDAGQGIQAWWESLGKWRREGTRSGVRSWGGRPPEPAGAAWGESSVDPGIRGLTSAVSTA